MKGILVFVYSNKLGDSTGDGISKNKTSLVLVGEGIPESYEGDETNTVELVKQRIGDLQRDFARPVNFPEKLKHRLMDGGNFIYCCDSAFPYPHPIPIHDRYERG